MHLRRDHVQASIRCLRHAISFSLSPRPPSPPDATKYDLPPFTLLLEPPVVVAKKSAMIGLHASFFPKAIPGDLTSVDGG